MKSKREIAVSKQGRQAMPLRTAITKGLAALLMALALVFAVTSCKTEPEDNPTYYTVTYSTEHASAPEKLTVTDGTALTAGQLPPLTESGYTFGGWYDGETKAEAGYKVTKNVTLTAKWTVNTYTVTLNSNGSTNTITATYGKPLPDLAAIPTLEGSTFGGYYTKQYAKGTKFIDKDGKGITAWNLTEDTTLYAAWGYSITYKNTKDVENTNPEIYTGEEGVTLANLEKEGYTFNGWFDAETGGNKVESIAQGSTGAKTLYAQWTLITYTITYEGLDGATNPNTATTYTIETDGITLTDASKTGYTFGGWKNANGDAVTKITKGSTGDITLTAQWMTISYNITYEGLNGATNSNPVTYTIETATITLQSPARTGYTFNGWYDAETGGNKVESIAQGSTGAKTLYAQWMLITYTITYEGLNGAENPNTTTSYTVESETITLQNPTRTGYIFGWYDAETGGNKVESIAQGSTGAKTLYAQWTAISYEITYVLPNGVTNPNVTSYTIESNTITLQSLARTGYTFNGWFDAETGGNKIESIAQGSTGAKTLYAQWTLITYTITYEGLNGAANPNTATSYTVESETITLQNPTKSGYTFVWMNGSDEVTQISKGSTGNITLMGKWTAISYEITYVLPDVVTNPNTVTSYTVETETITLQDFSHDYYTFEGWFDAETGGNKVTSIPKGSTGNKTLYAHCWIGTKNPTTAKSVGDIVFSDGSATAYSTDLTLSDAQKEAAVAVIYYAGSSAEDVLGAKTLGVGLKNATGSGNTLAWAKDGVNGYGTNITAIQCTPSESGSGKAATATFTGDTHGSDNWQTLCAAVSDEGTIGNYPAWEWVNAYATKNSLAGSYANGWYLPTVAELCMLYREKDTVNSALEKAGGTKIADTSYWSSSQYASIDYYAWGVWFDDGNLYYGYKDSHKSVCTVRAF